MVHIPDELIDSMKKSECVLFVGAGLSEGLPQWKELVEPLKKELELLADKPGTSLNVEPPIIASYYEVKFGREALQKKIVSQLQKEVKLTETHRTLSELPLKAIFTTNYDHLLEKALSTRKYVKIVKGKEAPLAGHDQLPLIKMHGDIDDPSTIVITQGDYDNYTEKHRALITYILGFLISCNILFVGYSLKDSNFHTIYAQVKSLFGESMRGSYAIFKNPSPFEVERLKKEKGIEVIPIEDYKEVPEIFKELREVCREKLPPRKFTPEERESVKKRFREITERQNKWLDPRGIFQFDKMLMKGEVELENVYVVPRLTRQEIIRRRKDRIQERDERVSSTQEYSIGEGAGEIEPRKGETEEDIFEKQVELTVEEAISDVRNNHMVILGEPGVGKTCLLQHIAFKVSTSAEHSGIKSVLPVLIPLREYPEFGRKQGEMFKEFVFHYIRSRILSLSYEILEELLESNSFFFLLDGLDEVVSQSERVQLSRQVEQFMSQYPGARIILTSRPAGYFPAKLIGAVPHFTLAEFNDDEIKEFLVKWFTFLDKVEGEGKSEEKANMMADIIIDSERILRLARNPLLLTILVLIQRVGKQLPQRRAEFYEYAVKTVAGTWEKWKSLHSEKKIPDQDIILAILEKIGYNLHLRKQENVVEVEELKQWLKEAMEEEIGHSSREEVNDFIWMLRERAGLLVERGFELYGFVHLTFQEYFAARYIAVGRGTDKTQNLIKRLSHNSFLRIHSVSL